MTILDVTQLHGRVRAGSVPAYGDLSEQIPAQNRRGELIVSAGFPSQTELTRLGDTWTTVIPTGSAFTHVADMPTTRAELALYNGESSSGKSYIINSVWWYCLTSITAASGATIIYQVNASAAALTDNTAVLINSPLGKTYAGAAKRALAVTTLVANKWAALAASPAGPAVSIGFGLFAPVNGGIIVRPGATLGVNVVVGTATGTALMGICWSEAVLDLG